MLKLTIRNSAVVIFFITLLFSCSTSNQVASNKIFQKRKYAKGWYINGSNSVESRSTKLENKTGAFEKISELVSDSIPAVASEVLEPKRKTEVSLNNNYSIKKIQTPKINFGKKLKETAVLSPVFSSKATWHQSSPTNLQSGSAQDPWLNDKTVNILLSILAILVLFFTGIAPLAVWIANGPGPALRTSAILYVTFLLSAAILIMTILYLALYSAGTAAVGIIGLAIVFGILSVVLGLVSFFHALISIIRGF